MKTTIKTFAALYHSIEKLPENDAYLNHLEAGRWQVFSKHDFLTSVRYLTLAFAAEGWHGRQIGLAISPSAHWLMIDYALMLSGGVSVPVFTNISAKNLRFQINDADLHTVFTQSEEQDTIILDADDSITCININAGGSGQPSLAALIRTGREIEDGNPDRFDNVLAEIRADDLITIVYTSGTTGSPKGVELTHTNLISQINDTSRKYAIDPAADKCLSLLPLAHIFERMVMHFYLSTGMSVYFADDVKNVANLLREIQPTMMTVVPRLLEKVCFKMQRKAMRGNPLKKLIAGIAFKRALQRKPDSSASGLDKLLDNVVYSKLRASMGGNLRMMISGGAPLSDDLYRFFLNIGIPLYQGYGLTESSPVICANAPGENRVGTCGRHFLQTEVKINDDGELLARGPGIMRGYHNNPVATREVIDPDGWLHTGDLASMDDEGYITITGRIKDLSKTSTGEYISTDYIEHLLMATGWFDHVLVVGNNRPFVTALLMTDESAAREFAQRHGFKETDEAVQSSRFHKTIKQDIARINRRLNQWERIRDFHFITHRLTITNGELTPSMKLAREVVEDHFKDQILAMYKKGHIW